MGIAQAAGLRRWAVEAEEDDALHLVDFAQQEDFAAARLGWVVRAAAVWAGSASDGLPAPMLLVLLVPAIEAAAAAEAGAADSVLSAGSVSARQSGSVAAAATLEAFVRAPAAGATAAAALAVSEVVGPYAGSSDPLAEEIGDEEVGVAEKGKACQDAPDVAGMEGGLAHSAATATVR